MHLFLAVTPKKKKKVDSTITVATLFFRNTNNFVFLEGRINPFLKTRKQNRINSCLPVYPVYFFL